MSVVQARPYHFETMKTARLLLGCAVFFVLVGVVLVPVLLHRGVYGVLASLGLAVLAVGALAVAASHADDAGLWFELQLRRKYRQVCARVGLAAKVGDRLAYAPYGQLIGSVDAFRLVIRPLVGQTVAEWEKAAPAFSLAYGSRPVRFEPRGDGLITMKVGVQVVGATAIEDVAEQTVDNSLMTWREYLATVEIGKNEHGDPFRLPLIDSHALIAGITGAGKGSWVWSGLLRLVPAAKAGVVRFWGFDPKRMELSMGRELFGDRYASKPQELVELMERACREMEERSDQLAGKARRFEPSTEHPLEILMIDELGFLAELLPDRNDQKRVDKALKALLVLGRAVGFTVIGALQDPRKSTLDVRDMFPNRVAMRLPKGMVDLVLGNGMYDAGAHCDLIPFKVGAGGAYVLGESSTVPQFVRASWVSDEAIRSAAESYQKFLDGAAPPALAS